MGQNIGYHLQIESLTIERVNLESNCGSKRRRVQGKKEDCIEDTNSMM